jgi:tRNA A37 threonylcarbamoyladenosine synthetase subunit TsaC/SUA5/YrdC
MKVSPFSWVNPSQRDFVCHAKKSSNVRILAGGVARHLKKRSTAMLAKSSSNISPKATAMILKTVFIASDP